ncbi:hypothetical protein SEA_A3WALLY_64 [Microbacterium phage A3Wally]|nr:hypothetical protein SEA_A3WALLY_64 [Microbacterium phage A3Wally]
MSRTYEEVLERFRTRMSEANHWRSRVAEFGELDSLYKMHYARERANELAWVLEGYDEERGRAPVVGGPAA